MLTSIHRIFGGRNNLRSRLLPAVGLLLLWPTTSRADTVNLGVVSLAMLIPGDVGPGVNAFAISNLTGEPGSGGFALPPDFPVLDLLRFLSSSLTLFGGTAPLTVTLGDLGPGDFDPSGLLEFPDTTLFTSARFTPTLSRTTFLLADGSIVHVDDANHHCHALALVRRVPRARLGSCDN